MIETAVVVATAHPHHSSQLIQDKPHAMLPALGKPMIARVMDQLYRAGIRHYIVILGLNEGSAAAYLRRQWVPDAQVELIIKEAKDDLPSVLGRVARQLNRPFLLASYNNFTHEQLIKSLLRLHEEYPDSLILSGAQSSLTHNPNEYRIVLDGDTVAHIAEGKPLEQASLVMLDYALFGHSALAQLQNITVGDKSALSKHIIDLVRDYLNTIATTYAETSWSLRVQSDRDLLYLNRRLLDDTNDTHILSELPPTVRIIPPVRIDPQVSVGQGAVIGPHVYLERGCTVGRNAAVSQSVVLERGKLVADSTTRNAIIAARGTIVVEPS